MNERQCKLMALLSTYCICLVLCGVREPADRGNWSVYFSPRGGARQAILDEIAAATRSVIVQAYSFTSVPIAEALVAAHDRGVDVRITLDRSNATSHDSQGRRCAVAGISVRVDWAHPVAHEKLIVVDHEVVIFGSYNFSKQAEERNWECLVVTRDSDLAGRFEANWQEHRGDRGAPSHPHCLPWGELPAVHRAAAGGPGR